jgi:hypothetical protein
MNSKTRLLVVKGMLTTLDAVEDGLERLRQEDADIADWQPAYEKVRLMLVDARRVIQGRVNGREAVK